MAEGDLGFSYRTNKRGEVSILHHGKHATTLRGDKASDFLYDAATQPSDDLQREMARLTGNYKRGNERLAKSHPRNQR